MRVLAAKEGGGQWDSLGGMLGLISSRQGVLGEFPKGRLRNGWWI